MESRSTTAGARNHLQELVSQLNSVLSSYEELAAAYLFGSVARGEARFDSDVDLGLVFRRRGATALQHCEMLLDLASRLECAAAGRRVDLVVLEPQGPIFCHRVLLEGTLIYEADRSRRVDFESETCIRAFDFRPSHEIATRGKIRAFRKWLGTAR